MKTQFYNYRVILENYMTLGSIKVRIRSVDLKTVVAVSGFFTIFHQNVRSDVKTNTKQK